MVCFEVSIRLVVCFCKYVLLTSTMITWLRLSLLRLLWYRELDNFLIDFWGQGVVCIIVSITWINSHSGSRFSFIYLFKIYKFLSIRNTLGFCLSSFLLVCSVCCFIVPIYTLAQHICSFADLYGSVWSSFFLFVYGLSSSFFLKTFPHVIYFNWWLD